MKLTRSLALLPASAALLLCLTVIPAAQAQAPLDLELNNSALTGNPGDTLYFSGTLSNLTGSDLFLNGDSLTFNGPADGLTVDDSPFLNSAPLSLGAMGSGTDVYTGPLFDVTIGSSAQPGTYAGVFPVLGGADGSTFDDVTSDPGNVLDPIQHEEFSVTVLAAPVPEASTTLSLGLLLALGGVGLWRAKRRTATAL